MKYRAFLFCAAAASLALASPAFSAEPPAPSPDRSAVDKIIAGWPERPRLGAEQMLAKYGVPQLVTSEKLVWLKPANYKRITVTEAEDHHDFPLPHMDYLEHTIDYKVPPGKADELMKFDGSVTFDRTRGEMSTRCDLEGHNLLSLNLANDVVLGKMDAEEARKAFGKNVADDLAGKAPPYTVALRFEPRLETPGDSDKTTMPGAPRRAVNASTGTEPQPKDTVAAGGDAEIMALVLAVNTNEIVAAMEAANKKLSPEIEAYAKMLHTEHGKNSEETMKLAVKLDVTPTETQKVNALRVKGAGELAALIPLDDAKFGPAYLDAMIKGHTEVLATMDTELLPMAKSEALKKHLTETREHVAMHLEKAKELKGTAKPGINAASPNL